MGEIPSGVLFVIDGHLEVLKDLGDSSEHFSEENTLLCPYRTIPAGNFVCESSLTSRAPVQFSLRAAASTDPTHVWKLDKIEFMRCLDQLENADADGFSKFEVLRLMPQEGLVVRLAFICKLFLRARRIAHVCCKHVVACAELCIILACR